MLFVPSSRHYLLPAAVFFVLILFVRIYTWTSPSVTQTLIKWAIESQTGHGVAFNREDFEQYLLPSVQDSSPWSLPTDAFLSQAGLSAAPLNHGRLYDLLSCRYKPNLLTDHIRLPARIHNITSLPNDHERRFNPTILALPLGSPHQYLLVSRLVTAGLHQESHICLADICHHPNNTSLTSGPSQPCNATYFPYLESIQSKLLHCTVPPETLNIPPTPARNCTGPWSSFPHIPGFHDPRIFWSSQGEPLVIVNSASQYGCLGLWMVDLRSVYKPLAGILGVGDGKRSKNQINAVEAPPIYYPTLTELTRNPANARQAVEKNWFLWFDGDEAFVHYDMGIAPPPGANSSQTSVPRAFAKLIGNGFTTPSLALTTTGDPSCLASTPDKTGKIGHWHQSSNALQLILCTRAESRRSPESCKIPTAKVNLALMHRKFSNEIDLPRRYERHFVVWESSWPYRMLAVSAWPMLLWNETAGGWTGWENWAVEREVMGQEGSQHDIHLHAGSAQGWNWTMDTVYAVNDSIPLFWPKSNESTAPAATAGTFLNLTNPVLTSPCTTIRCRSINNTTEFTQLEFTKSSPDDSFKSNLNKPWAYFTYTPSIAWAWRPSTAFHTTPSNVQKDNTVLRNMHVGYLDDEIILGIGLEDTAQTWAMVKAGDIVGCLRLCGL